MDLANREARMIHRVVDQRLCNGLGRAQKSGNHCTPVVFKNCGAASKIKDIRSISQNTTDMLAADARKPMLSAPCD